jgi:hypothetical protein
MSYLDMLKAARARRHQTGSSAEHVRDLRSERMEAWTRLLGLPLDVFETKSSIIEIRVPFLVVTLFFVSTDKEVKTLSREGISRGRIWTARELIDLLSIPMLTQDNLTTVAQTKVVFDADLAEIRQCELSEESELSPEREPRCELSEESEERGQGWL